MESSRRSRTRMKLDHLADWLITRARVEHAQILEGAIKQMNERGIPDEDQREAIAWIRAQLAINLASMKDEVRTLAARGYGVDESLH